MAGSDAGHFFAGSLGVEAMKRVTGFMAVSALLFACVVRAGDYDTPTDAELGFVKSSRSETLASLKRIAVVTQGWPDEFADRDDARQALSDAVARQLRASRFDVVSGQDFDAAFERASVKAGGIFDSNSGNVRKDVRARVLAEAWREYATREHLDAIAFVNVDKRIAEFNGSFCEWDGVIERTDGGRASKSILALSEVDAFSGATFGISMSLTLIDRAGDIVFARRAGLQLESYATTRRKEFDFNSASRVDLVFRSVAPQDLLRDTARIDRAAAIVAAPLRYLPQQLARAKLLHPSDKDVRGLPDPPPPASVEPTHVSLLLPHADVMARIQRIAILPVQAGSFWLPDESRQRIEEQLRDDLGSRLGLEIIDTPQLRTALQRSLSQRGMFDPLSGKLDAARVRDLRGQILREIGAGARPHAILWVALEPARAKFVTNRVTWDGVTQDGRLYGFNLPWAYRNSYSGELDAVSLTARIFDADDHVIYSGRGGLHLLETVMGNGVAPLSPSARYAKKEYETVAAQMALSGLIYAPAVETPTPSVPDVAPTTP